MAALSAISNVTKLSVRSAFAQETVPAIGAPDIAADILTRQSEIETASWTAWYFQGPQPDQKPPTYNLMNRHAGSGRGEWTGQTKYVARGDEDLRIYTDIYQSARDYVELLNDPLYRVAKQKLVEGDGAGYFQALEDAGFNNHNGDYAAAGRAWLKEYA